MGMICTGKSEGLLYSLSRWTDLPIAKWDWFKKRLEAGFMLGVDPRTLMPGLWSLKPEDVLGLVFWTKNPTNLIEDAALLNGFPLVVHVTLTGWTEVEHGAPNIKWGLNRLQELVRVFGPEKVIWRFSPVPAVSDVVDRFQIIAREVEKMGIPQVYVAFLQTNDLMQETRSLEVQQDLLGRMADSTNLQVLVCNENRVLDGEDRVSHNLHYGVCEDGSRFHGTQIDGSISQCPTEGCGCALAVDPFTTNESCSMSCAYCLDPDTPVLFSDLTWRPLHEVKVGDRLIGFDESAPGYRKDRKFRETVVESVWASKKPTIRINTEEGEIITTANHQWLSGIRSGWVATDHLNLNSKLRQLGHMKTLPFTDLYCRGYLSGMTLGDGTFRYEPGQGRLGFPQPYWRVALVDEEPLSRLVSYLARFGVESHISRFDSGSPWTKKAMQKVEVRALGNLQRIHEILLSDSSNLEFRRGFLAGFYDLDQDGDKLISREGTRSDRCKFFYDCSIRRDQVEHYAKSLGFSMTSESFKGAKPRSARLSGRLKEHIRFLSTIRPALSRKSRDFLGRTLDCTNTPILSIERGFVKDVIDIQTSTHTFFAAGLATHNCYSADRSLAEERRDTTRLRVVR